MLLVASGLLVLCALLVQVVDGREVLRAETSPTAAPPEQTKTKEVPKGAYELVFRVRYLLLLALFSTIFTWVNTNGEYILGKLVSEAADAALASGELANEEAKGEWIGGRFAEFFLYVNIATFLLQTFVVSRILKYGGLEVAFFVFPVIALLDATAAAVAPVLAIVFIGKVAENATDYSLNNTVRNVLWLPTTTEMKYKAKQAVDTLFVRLGDVSSAVVVGLLAGGLALSVRWFAVLNVVLVAAWLVLAVAIVRENKRMHAARE
jgi:AAA family ATP:ADP antiporter